MKRDRFSEDNCLCCWTEVGCSLMWFSSLYVYMAMRSVFLELFGILVIIRVKETQSLSSSEDRGGNYDTNIWFLTYHFIVRRDAKEHKYKLTKSNIWIEAYDHIIKFDSTKPSSQHMTDFSYCTVPLGV